MTRGMLSAIFHERIGRSADAVLPRPTAWKCSLVDCAPVPRDGIARARPSHELELYPGGGQEVQ